MFSPSFCKTVAKIPEWGCGTDGCGHLHNTCKCKHKKKKGFYSSQPWYHYPDKPLKFRKKSRFQKQWSKPWKFIKHRSKKSDKATCFICGNPGHWANKCPKKKQKPKLAAFCERIDPQWWTLPEDDDAPTGDILFFPSDDDTDKSSDNGSEAALGKFGPSSSSSSDSDLETDDVLNLGGFEPLEFEFSLNMFTFSRTQELEKKLATIDLELSMTQPYQYPLRAALCEEKDELLKQLDKDKGK